MLRSPARRFLWQYFLYIMDNAHLGRDTVNDPDLIGLQNPFRTHIPQMAMSHNALRAAILCFTALQYRTLESSYEQEDLRRLTEREASISLTAQVANSDEVSSDLPAVAAAVFLHIFHGHNSKLQAAISLAIRYLSRRPTRRPPHGSAFQMVFAFLRWAVISNMCSLDRTGDTRNQIILSELQLTDEEVSRNFSPLFRGWIVHPIYEFSSLLVNPLLTVSALLQEQQRQSVDLGELGNADRVYDAKVNDVEEMILVARDMDGCKIDAGTPDSTGLLALNESMYAAAFLLVYARLRKMPSTASIIRRFVTTITTEIAKIDPNSRVYECRFFPLFIAGCEAVDQDNRRSVEALLREPLRALTYHRGDMVSALAAIWQIRDERPGEQWPEWLYSLSAEHRIKNLF
ncbi:hypothetical protein LTS10_008377 [Elasticomyces elasticus]|nr:hypothetical protein LTS10_008377 [Elasticomyces elasticus]